MSFEVEVVVEEERGCGFRHSGPDGVGIYLVSGDEVLVPCPRLPFPLTICPCCGAGVKFSRSFTWIDPSRLLDPALDPRSDFQDEFHDAALCRICNPGGTVGDKAGLIWIGEKFYPTAAHFSREAARMGISRRVPAVPNGFRVGFDAIYLAHIKAVPPNLEDLSLDPDAPWTPGIFRSFVPQRVELVIDDPDDVPEKAIKLKERLGAGARIVKVIPNKQEELVFDE